MTKPLDPIERIGADRIDSIAYWEFGDDFDALADIVGKRPELSWYAPLWREIVLVAQEVLDEVVR